ncbi:MAG TPA: basic secretory protein-like protein [Nitrososphaerales archaeon]
MRSITAPSYQASVNQLSEVIKGNSCQVDYSKFPLEKEYAIHVATLAGLEIPNVKSIHTGRNPDDEITFKLGLGNEDNIASTNGKEVTLYMNWFDKIKSFYGRREDDDGAIVHEISHAILWAPEFNPSKLPPIEGIADYVRHKRGGRREQKEMGDKTISKAYPYYEKGGILTSFNSQVYAHFLLHLEKRRPTIVADIVRELVNNSYDENITFPNFFGGKTLPELVKTYEDEEERKIIDEQKKNRPRPFWESFYAMIVESLRRIIGRK